MNLAIIGMLVTIGAGAEAPTGLMVDLITRPELAVITSRKPEFSWIVNDPRQGAVQTAYQIVVGQSDQSRNVWDSGKIQSNQSVAVPYGGIDLENNKRYQWQVRTWDAEGKESPISTMQFFWTGEIGAKRAWPGESRWVKIKDELGERWVPEDRHASQLVKIAPVKLVRKGPGHWFVDFGKDAVSTLVLNISSEQDGKTITVLLGEKKRKDDSVDPEPGGTIVYRKEAMTVNRGTREYVLAIPRVKLKMPNSQQMPDQLPEVQPFRYAEIIDCPSELKEADVRQLAMFYPFDDNAAAFSCDDERLNRVYELCRYTLKATPFMGLYVDGTRERMPYEADAYIQQLGHYSVDREYAVGRYSMRYLAYHATWPTEWIMHSVLMAHAEFMATGSTRTIEQDYELLKAKTLSALERKDGLISTQTGLMTRPMLDSVRFTGKELRDIVDWPHGGSNKGRPAGPTSTVSAGEIDSYVFKPMNTVINAFHYRSLVLMGEMAGAIGKKDDAAAYAKRADQVKKAFNKIFFDAKQSIYMDGEGTDHASQHANFFPLAFGMVPPEHVAGVAKYIQSRGMACGPYGAQYLLESLYDARSADAAFGLMVSDSDRSWLNMMRIGSTLTTEAWDVKYKPNFGWNHAWGTPPVNIIPRKLMGIEPTAPGYASVIIRPQLGPLKHATMKLPTIRGSILCEAKREGGIFTLSVTIPANMTAQVELPGKSERIGAGTRTFTARE